MAIDWSVVDPDTSAKVAESFYAGQRNALSNQKGQQELQSNALKLQQDQYAIEQQNKLRDYLYGGNTSAPEFRTGLARFGESGMKVAKSLSDQEKAAIDAQRAKSDLLDAKLKQSRNFLDTIDPNDPNAPVMYIQWHEGNHKDPIIGEALAARGITADQARAGIEKAIQQGPKAFAALLNSSKLGVEKFAEMSKPTVVSTDLGGAALTRAYNPMTGEFTTIGSERKTMSPADSARLAQSERHFQATQNAPVFNADIGGFVVKPSAKNPQGSVVPVAGVVGKRVQDVEMKLQDDYRAESKGFSETSTAMKKVLGSIDTADKNPGSALAAGTAFMKLLDPNSVVRESELGMALNASGWFDRATNVANTLQAGKIMTPTQKANLKSAAETLFNEAKAAQREVDAAYEQRAKSYGADPSRVIVQRGQKDTGTQTGPKVGMIQDGYRFKGGNPADPKSWEKQ